MLLIDKGNRMTVGSLSHKRERNENAEMHGAIGETQALRGKEPA